MDRFDEVETQARLKGKQEETKRLLLRPNGELLEMDSALTNTDKKDEYRYYWLGFFAGLLGAAIIALSHMQQPIATYTKVSPKTPALLERTPANASDTKK